LSDKLFLSPAEGQRWGLGLDDVVRALRERWPNAVIQREDKAPQRVLIDFRFEHRGRPRLGAYFTVPNEFLSLESSDIDVAPEISAWFLGLTPAGVSNLIYTPSLDAPIPVPAHADEATLREIYDSLGW